MRALNWLRAALMLRMLLMHDYMDVGDRAKKDASAETHLITLPRSTKCSLSEHTFILIGIRCICVF